MQQRDGIGKIAFAKQLQLQKCHILNTIYFTTITHNACRTYGHMHHGVDVSILLSYVVSETGVPPTLDGLRLPCHKQMPGMDPMIS